MVTEDSGVVYAISTHTPLAGRDTHGLSGSRRSTISTHTPLAGRDMIGIVGVFAQLISTHTPLAGRDLAPGRSVRQIC